VTPEEEIRDLRRRMSLMEHSMVRLATLVAVLSGVPQEQLDEAIMEEQASIMREEGEI
jgi:hypothetical protein